MNQNNFNEVLKAREAEEKRRLDAAGGKQEELSLDDTQRVKVLSPGRLVAKRFVRNKLAIAGSCILLFMFLFAFLGPVLYAHGQTEIFYKWDKLRVNYAAATERKDFTTYAVDENASVPSSVTNKMTSYVKTMVNGELDQMVAENDGSCYLISKFGDGVYGLYTDAAVKAATLGYVKALGTYNSFLKSELDVPMEQGFYTAMDKAIKAKEDTFTYGGATYSLKKGGVKNTYEVTAGASDEFVFTGADLGEDFAAAFAARTGNTFAFGGKTYLANVSSDGKAEIYEVADGTLASISSTLVLDAYTAGTNFSSAFKSAALQALYGTKVFEADGVTYQIVEEDDTFYIRDAEENNIAIFSEFAIRRANGEDTLSLEFKAMAHSAIEEIGETGKKSASFTFALPEVDENGNALLDESGKQILIDTVIDITLNGTQYNMSCEQLTHMIDIYGAPSGSHLFGTDADGMDILARMMYGGRISLMVGFIVVLIETILGVIMGGIAGYFGGWIDTLIMRLVDIFYCIPTYPILIILGAFFDEIKLGSYERLAWMMAVLGFLGWASVARLVRGQILSLREQEFMTAAEATGISTSRRIFRHLVPNVMPQLIVSATMGLGSVIITESTLSFLGLGVKHPLATWGTMINQITSSNENLAKYAYIWIPVGCLICLTVIAFNFVGDGLRDAFDPKMK